MGCVTEYHNKNTGTSRRTNGQYQMTVLHTMSTSLTRDFVIHTDSPIYHPFWAIDIEVSQADFLDALADRVGLFVACYPDLL